MKGRRFPDLARKVFPGGTEVHWRGAVGRAYYALMLECREALFRWGFKLPPRDNVHTWVRLRFSFPADPDLKTLGSGKNEAACFCFAEGGSSAASCSWHWLERP